ncbi:MAG: HlyD family efflux transporter periplasmic adaptor subunit [Chlorobi bacterium]|nr:HlyD family efflux transporter periplasmic adaptor subunit [Chlorobiota bacterium]
MKRKNVFILLGLLALVVAVVWYFSSSSGTESDSILVKAKTGKFVIDVTTTGELEARSSEEIRGPNPIGLRNARIWQLRIEDIVPDGTVVDSGQWVATLDRSDLENKIKDQELEVEKLQTQHLQTQLDTSMTMRAARDELVNLKYSLEEKKIVMDQSVYEPPATQRQAKLDYERTQRTYKQAVKNYRLKYEKAKADMQEVSTNLEKARRRLQEFRDLMKEFTIKAPKAGMVTYKKSWSGKKQGVGAQISTWDNVVATLPNLSSMNSKTYVNEIDISKVAVGQKAEISVDAFPGKKFTGEVISVANMGEQMQNSNAKVFEVIIHVDGFDSILRPSMTTKNRIITEVIDSALYVPIECIYSNDSINFVYKKSYKQQVIPGKSNENDIIILKGLKDGDEIYLEPPAGAEKWKIHYLEGEAAVPSGETEKAEGTEKVEDTAGSSTVPSGEMKGTPGGLFSFYIVVGSFADMKEAEKMVSRLNDKGFTEAGTLKSGKNIRVYAGRYQDIDSADRARQKLSKDYRGAWIYKEKRENTSGNN